VFQRNAKALRESLERSAGWPRDARAWVRYDRLLALLSELEYDPPQDLIPRTRLIEEIAQWVDREDAWLVDCPLIPPSTWIRRPIEHLRDDLVLVALPMKARKFVGPARRSAPQHCTDERPYSQQDVPRK
jgi:hypothetical protein